MANRRRAADREPLDEAARFRLAFRSQAHANPVAAEFTAEEQASFAELVGPDGKFVADIAERFNALWRAHGERRVAEAKSDQAAAQTKAGKRKRTAPRVRPA